MSRPLADRLRPTSLDDVVGQDHLVGPNGLLRRLLSSSHLPSLILWGPPGTGKTTLAQILARQLDASFTSLSAVSAGVKELRSLADNSPQQSLFQRSTVLFVDEIHRFNKAQQDALLPYVERGTFILIGATTENPGFEINAALLSRCRVFEIKPIDDASMGRLIDRAFSSPSGVNQFYRDSPLTISSDAKAHLIKIADGDARAALTVLEVAASGAHSLDLSEITVDLLQDANQYRSVRYDKAGENHYQTVSAFIKSMRGSDPDAALYYMTRMLEGGEDPNFILRRMIIFASEDIGNADPRALSVAVDAQKAFHFIGMPEGVLPMTQACTYLATAPKSNAIITSYGRARRIVRETGTLPIPDHIVNAPTALDKAIGKGRGYKYPHNFTGNYVPEDYLPESLVGTQLYIPSDNGYEADIKNRLNAWRSATDAKLKDDLEITNLEHGKKE